MGGHSDRFRDTSSQNRSLGDRGLLRVRAGKVNGLFTINKRVRWRLDCDLMCRDERSTFDIVYRVWRARPEKFAGKGTQRKSGGIRGDGFTAPAYAVPARERSDRERCRRGRCEPGSGAEGLVAT